MATIIDDHQEAETRLIEMGAFKVGTWDVPQGATDRQGYETASWFTDFALDSGKASAYAVPRKDGKYGEVRLFALVSATVTSAYLGAEWGGVSVGGQPQFKKHRSVGMRSWRSIPVSISDVDDFPYDDFVYVPFASTRLNEETGRMAVYHNSHALCLRESVISELGRESHRLVNPANGSLKPWVAEMTCEGEVTRICPSQFETAAVINDWLDSGHKPEDIWGWRGLDRKYAYVEHLPTAKARLERMRP